MVISDQTSAYETYRELLLHAEVFLRHARVVRLAGDRKAAFELLEFGRLARLAAISFAHTHLPREN